MIPLRWRPTKAQVKKIADISSDIAQVFFASLVVPGFIDIKSLSMIGLGLVSSIVFWTTSVIFMKGVHGTSS